MKKPNTLAQLTTQELTKQKKLITGVFVGFGFVMLVAYGILFYLMFRNKDFTLAIIIPLGIVTLLPSFIRLNQINAEIKTRNTQNK